MKLRYVLRLFPEDLRHVISVDTWWWKANLYLDVWTLSDPGSVEPEMYTNIFTEAQRCSCCPKITFFYSQKPISQPHKQLWSIPVLKRTMKIWGFLNCPYSILSSCLPSLRYWPPNVKLKECFIETPFTKHLICILLHLLPSLSSVLTWPIMGMVAAAYP